MFLTLAATFNKAIMNKDILKKSLKNCLLFLECFVQFSPLENLNCDRTFAECVISTIDLSHIYSYIFKDGSAFNMKFKYFLESISDRVRIFLFMYELYQSRKKDLFTNALGSKLEFRAANYEELGIQIYQFIGKILPYNVNTNCSSEFQENLSYIC